MTRDKPDSHYYLYLYAIGAFIVASAALWTARHRPAVQQFISHLSIPLTDDTSSQSTPTTTSGTQDDQDTTQGSATPTPNPTISPQGTGYFPMFAFAYQSGAQQQSEQYVAASDAETAQALLMLENEALASQQQQQAASAAAQQIEAQTPTVKAGK